MIAFLANICYNSIMKVYRTPLFSYDHIINETPESNDYYQHIQSEYEFLYFVRGNANIIIDGSVYTLHKRDLVCIPAGSYHCLIPLQADPYERFCIHFSKKLIVSHMQSALKNFNGVYHIEKNSVIDLFFSSLFQFEYTHKYEEKDMLFFIQQNLSLLLMHLKYQQSIPTVNQTPHVLDSITNYIDANLTQPITAKTLAKTFFKSESWITHTFAKVLRIPLKQYINYKKIIYAQQLIEAGELPTAVALKLSFENYTTFYRAYIRFLHKTPNKDTPPPENLKAKN